MTPETLAEGVTAHDASGQKITGKMVQGGGKSVQTDWDQTDETAPDFLKNKPFYKQLVSIELLPYTKLEYDAEVEAYVALFSAPLVIGEMYSVNYNGVIYQCEAWDASGWYTGLGSKTLVGGDDTGEPFVILTQPGGTDAVMMPMDDATDVSCGVGGNAVLIKRMDAECAPYIEFYLGDDDYIYKDAALTEKAYYGDVQTALSMRVPLYVCHYDAVEPLVNVSKGIETGSDGISYFYATIRIVSGSSESAMGISLLYKEYYTAERIPE